MMILFGTCHTVIKKDDEHLGDQVDLRMYEHSKFVKNENTESDIYQDAKYEGSYEIVKVHQFESKFQSMSVLVYDKARNQYYCFSKGAP